MITVNRTIPGRVGFCFFAGLLCNSLRFEKIHFLSSMAFQNLKKKKGEKVQSGKKNRLYKIQVLNMLLKLYKNQNTII